MNIGNMAKGMNDVERFDAPPSEIGKYPDGPYVRYTDYAEVRRLYQAEISTLQQQLAAAREALAEMTADRDSWCDQAAARVNDWHEAREALRAAEADAERYRWLRDKSRSKDVNWLADTDGSRWDAYIDGITKATLQRDRQP